MSRTRATLLALQGSPRLNGNTALLLDTFLNGVGEADEGVRTERLNTAELNVAPCRGCSACKEKEALCIIRDDMDQLYPLIREASLIILASPIYWWHMTAQMKACIDRIYAMDFSSFKGKQIGFLSTFGGSEEESGYLIARESVASIARFLRMEFSFSFGVSTGEQGLRENTAALGQARELGRSLHFPR